MGSLVSDEYLRFDFPHFHKLDTSRITAIEDMVNSKIQENIKVETIEDISIEEANRIPNVKKFFGEKYGSKVRVVIMDERYSIEFCGGTHVSNTEDIGLFKIIKEESISSGIRRIFAKTGEGIINLMDEKIINIEKIVSELPDKYTNNFISGIKYFRTNFKEIDFRDAAILRLMLEYQDNTIKSLYELREKYIDEKKQQEKMFFKKHFSELVDELDALISNAAAVNGNKVLAKQMNLKSMEELKEIGETMRNKMKNGIGLIAAIINGKINLVCTVSDNLIKEKNLNAGKLISGVAKELGGGGGGRPQIATAGGKDIEKLDEVLKNFINRIKNQI